MCNSSKSEKSTGVVFALLWSLRSLHYNIRTVQSPHSSYNTPECGITIEYTIQRATCDDAKLHPASYAICINQRNRPAISLAEPYQMLMMSDCMIA